MTSVMSRKEKILVVEDEKDVRDLILLHLKREGFETTGVDNGEEALRLFKTCSFDLAILDWMLPGVSGLDLCKNLVGKLPVLMVTARADTTDIVLGLEMGADDYISKPFETPVLMARVRALLRRSQGKVEDSTKLLRCGELCLNLDTYQVTCDSKEVQLTISEFKLLAALMTHRGRVLSRDQLIELVQGQGVVVIDRAIDTHIFGLRKKLGPSADVIETIRGVGYRAKVWN